VVERIPNRPLLCSYPVESIGNLRVERWGWGGGGTKEGFSETGPDTYRNITKLTNPNITKQNRRKNTIELKNRLCSKIVCTLYNYNVRCTYVV
jgi:hypothetical protein